MTQAIKPRVMVADDEAHSRLLLKSVLKSMNCEVVGEASNGEEVLELYRRLRPQLLLLDINMPLKSGDEVLRDTLREFPDAFIIMVTSVSDANSVEKCIMEGAANYIRKDTPLQEMKQIIKETWVAFIKNRTKPPE